MLYEWATSGFPVADGWEKDPEWTALMFRVDETSLIDAKELASAQATMSPAQYRQEFLCDFSASSDNILIPIDLVSEACRRNAVEYYAEGSPKILGVDVARYGDDRSVILKRTPCVTIATHQTSQCPPPVPRMSVLRAKSDIRAQCFNISY
jgi:hypothetical protein